MSGQSREAIKPDNLILPEISTRRKLIFERGEALPGIDRRPLPASTERPE
jgi:hypothetical protein